ALQAVQEAPGAGRAGTLLLRKRRGTLDCPPARRGDGLGARVHDLGFRRDAVLVRAAGAAEALTRGVGPSLAIRACMRAHRSHLDILESESVHVLREVAAWFERPYLLFSGGKDSIVLAWLARKAFHPARSPFPLLHIDTGHNFPETIRFRDHYACELGAELVVRSVQDSIDRGRVKEEGGPEASRNALQTVTLLDALSELRADAAIGGARRDEEKARAKERFFSHRDRF